MRTLGVWVVCLGLIGCWYERARPVAPQPRASSTPQVSDPPPAAATGDGGSYRAVTIAVDAVGVAALATGAIGLLRGANEDRSAALSTAGVLLAGYTVPVIHLAHRQGARSGYSFLTRVIGSMMGSITGAIVACPEATLDLGCKLGGMMLGTAGGLAVAAVIDAAFFHRDERAREPSWAPTMSVTDKGARVGLAMPF